MRTMFHTELEIASQLDCWREAAVRARSAGHDLPRLGERVAVIGCGTSLFMALSYAALREASGHGETDAFAASEYPTGRRYDCVLALTRSGTTTEVLETLTRLPSGTRTAAITADPRTPIVGAVDTAVVLDFADEQSVVQTRFATTTLLFLRAHLGEDTEAVISDAARALDAKLDVEATKRSQFTFLGQGWTVGLALEAALKMREAAGAWSEAYPAMEYRHGPISVTGECSLVWMLGTPPPGLAGEVANTGATFVVAELDPLAELIRAQRLAVAVALLRGCDPDNPRHLTRSVILSGAATGW